MKDYREKELKYLLFILVFLFLIWCTPLLSIMPNADKKNSYEVLSTLIESVIISGVLSLGAFLCDCLINSKSKDKLVGLFFIPRPGETVFSRIDNGSIVDNRFLVEDAKNKYSDIILNLPVEEKAKRRFENSRWYNIYLLHQEKGQVMQSQKDSLICRDLFIETILFSVFYFMSLVVFYGSVTFSWKFIILLCAIAIVSNRATHIKMNRFVNTVIAVDIASVNNKQS